MSLQRKLKLLNVTELDRVTRKVAHQDQNLDYNLLVGEEFTEYFPTEQGTCMILYGDAIDGLLRTSDVRDIEETESHLTVVTRNTVYLFTIIEGV